MAADSDRAADSLIAASAARDERIRKHAYLVYISAQRLLPRHCPQISLEDLEGEGYVALVSAADRFDPARGVRFSTFAIAMIRGRILEYLREQDWMPRLLRTQLRALDAATSRLEETLQRAPSDIEIAEEMGIAEEKLSTLRRQSAYGKTLS